MSQRISYTVEGNVQGVNYRAFAVEQAKRLGITGFAKNASDGTVVGEAQGDASSLKEFVSHLKSGPSAANVFNFKHDEIQTKSGDSGFQRL
ncbi:Acylphosphatase [Piedraia hortae CBS 480.64]|uniref:acylphosphatase n=1 Tax=Piedraia hortae CBS 480.64 TaxID=1314780 RepID=A0A6A7C6D3_9PEZI|nr:Acylphosphatase [Piedraia hortae CBS 480.64]